MRKLGHLHYQVRGLSLWCAGDAVARAMRDECGGAYLADRFGRGGDSHSSLVALCTCDCHAYNNGKTAKG